MHSKRRQIPRLHVITDESLQTRFTHAELAQMAVEGGADAVQYREKRQRTTRELVETASSLVRICEMGGAVSVINDRVDVCKAAKAVAVHLGSEDFRVSVARDILGEQVVIGGTANSFDEVLRVAKTPIDYLGVGPVFGTKSKANPAATLGIAALAEICAAVQTPVIAIGNIQIQNVEEVMDAGAWGVAVLSGVVTAQDVTKATREYRKIIDSRLSEH